MIIDLHAKRALEGLPKRYCVTQGSILEKLITDAEHVAIGSACVLPNGHADYYDGKLHLNS